MFIVYITNIIYIYMIYETTYFNTHVMNIVFFNNYIALAIGPSWAEQLKRHFICRRHPESRTCWRSFCHAELLLGA